jgi:hypothetical protein
VPFKFNLHRYNLVKNYHVDPPPPPSPPPPPPAPTAAGLSKLNAVVDPWLESAWFQPLNL